MPKQSMPRKRVAQEDYDSDGGFVEDAPKSKKSKNIIAKPQSSYEISKDDDGNEYWEISGKRRLTISEFKGNTMVSVREYYDDKSSGKTLPGKKGISLTLDQFDTLIELLPQVENVLMSRGAKVSRPDYDQQAVGATTAVGANEEGVEADGENVNTVEEAGTSKTSGSKLDKFKHKANHEATSDEDDG